MKLYYAPGACSLSPHIVALEGEIPLSLEKVDLKTHRTEHGEDYYTVNPKGYVPALRLDNGEALTEGPVIVQYLADRRPEATLAPPEGSFARYRLQEWLTFINGEIHKSFTPLFANAKEDDKAEARKRIGKRLAFVEKTMGDRPFLMGERFSIADAYLFVMLFWAHRQNLAIAQWPKLESYYARVHGRPKVQEALKSEGLTG